MQILPVLQRLGKKISSHGEKELEQCSYIALR